MIWQIAVTARNESYDGRGRAMAGALRQAGFTNVTAVKAVRLFQLSGQLDRAAVEMLARDLFADETISQWSCSQEIDWPECPHALVEVHLQPGVMDPVAMSSVAAARDLLDGFAPGSTHSVEAVRTAWRYELVGADALDTVEAAARQVLANACIESVFVCGLGRRDVLPQRFPESPERPFEKRTVSLAGLSDDELARLSRDAHLFLSVEEMQAVRTHFAQLGRDPTDLELETIAQTWSEHCVHKTLKAEVTYRGRGFGDDGASQVEVTYENLLKETVVRATQELDKPWCLSVFVDNAGVIEFDERFGVAFKVETHNHPSAIEPYGGAATGAGGCIRDILGCGLGAKPIANTDVFCVADPDFEARRLPPGVLHPRRILRGVVGGVRDYGNRMGIPTVAGALHFDNRYLANPLVFCGCVGTIPRNRIEKAPQAGDYVVVAGGRTGRDGIGGATFSSAELTDTHADEFAHAVQIGNAIEEKKVLDALLKARDHADGCLYTAVTDCGAGGLSSAVGEMGETLGAVVDLEKAPLKYSGLRYNEIWLSEAQERMVYSVPPENLDKLLAVFAAEEVETAVIGTFTGDGVLTLRYRGAEVGRLDVDFLHNGIPKKRMAARWEKPKASPMAPVHPIATSDDLGRQLLDRIGHINTCSRESIYRQYDFEVQGGTVIKPSVGRGEGPSDAAVIRPLPDLWRGVALGAGLCPQLSDVDPYAMAVQAIDESVRNVVCVGADPDRIAILDNFCWGGCEDETEMGSLVRACQGCYDAATAHGTPFISGKDSLNNQFSLSPEEARRLGLPPRIAIPATLLISAIGIVEDVRRCVTADLKRAGNRLAAVWAHGLAARAAMHRAMAAFIQTGQVAACHDVSDGGLGVCVAEMCIGGGLGAELTLPPAESVGHHSPAELLFDEAWAPYLIEVAPAVDLSALSRSASVAELGVVTADRRLAIAGAGLDRRWELPIEQLESAWRSSIGLSEGAA